MLDVDRDEIRGLAIQYNLLVAGADEIDGRHVVGGWALSPDVPRVGGMYGRQREICRLVVEVQLIEQRAGLSGL